jgi:hypothetical protein
MPLNQDAPHPRHEKGGCERPRKCPFRTHIRTHQAGADLPHRVPIRWWKATILKNRQSPAPTTGPNNRAQRQAFAVFDIDAEHP